MSYIGPCKEVYIHFYCCFSNLKDSRCQISMMPKDAIWAFLIADVCKVSLDLQAHFCLPEWARKWLTIRTGSCIIADVKSVWLASLWKEWPCCQLCKAEPTMFRFMGFFFWFSLNSMLKVSLRLCFCLSATLTCHHSWTVLLIDLKLDGWVGLPSALKVKVTGQGHPKVKVICHIFFKLATVSIPLNWCSPNLAWGESRVWQLICMTLRDRSYRVKVTF